MLWLPENSYEGELPPLSKVQEILHQSLKKHIQILAGEIGARSLTRAPDGLEKAAQYLEKVFAKYRYQTVHQLFDADAYGLDQSGTITKEATRYQAKNIIAEIPGTQLAEEIIIVGAHYDTEYDCPGANDNGSGIAALLELANLLWGKPAHRTLRFVAFANEEQPFARTEQMGSYQYAKSCKDKNENIVAMICLETMGFYTSLPHTQELPDPALKNSLPDTGNFVAFVSNLQSAGLMARCIESFRNHTKFPSQALAAPVSVRGIDFSDHYYFWKNDYPAIMVTDTAFYRYTHYHQPADTPDKIDYDGLTRVVSGLAHVVEDLCQGENQNSFQTLA